jgi:AcrR family transcriptional regulator
MRQATAARQGVQDAEVLLVGNLEGGTLGAPGAPPAAVRPSAARARILDTVDRLFYDEGIRAVGVHRVVDEARVTRVTFYRHFPAKDDLVVAYLRRRADGDRRQVRQVLDTHRGDPRGALRELARRLVEIGFGNLHRGCPFINAAAEFSDPDHPVRRAVAEHRVWLTEVFEDLVRALGDPRPADTAHLLMMLRTGAVVAAALDGQAAPGQEFVDAVDRIVDRIVDRGVHPDSR